MSRSLRTIFDEGNPNKTPLAAQISRLGTLLALSSRFVRGAVASNVLVLPEAAKAIALLAVRSVAGTATGRLTIDTNGGTPAAGSAAINATGDVEFAAADAVTEAEVTYLSAEGAIVEDVIPVAADSGTLLASRSALMLLEAESLAGTTVGPLTVAERGSAPGAGAAAASDAGTTVDFNAADAVTSARVKYIAAPGEGTAKPAVVPNLDAVDQEF